MLRNNSIRHYPDVLAIQLQAELAQKKRLWAWEAGNCLILESIHNICIKFQRVIAIMLSKLNQWIIMNL